MQLDVGQRFDRYQVVRQLGNGISGESYEAYDTLLERTVTLKLIHPWTTLSDAIRRQFFRELQNMSQLNHPALTNILDYGDIEGQLYLARRYTEFSSLLGSEGRSWFSPPLPLENALRYTIQFAQALHYLHANRFLHGAITLSNILVQQNPLKLNTSTTTMPLVLADAGTANFVRHYGHPFITLLPITAAPEQFSKRTIAASDQYALATIFYYWLAGCPPFLGAPEEVEQQKRRGEVVPLSTLNPHVTPKLAQVIQRALKGPVDERYSSLQAFAEALQHAYEPSLYRETNPALPSLGQVETHTSNGYSQQEQRQKTAPLIPPVKESRLEETPFRQENNPETEVVQIDTALIEAFATLTIDTDSPPPQAGPVIAETDSTDQLDTLPAQYNVEEVPSPNTPVPETPAVPVQPEPEPQPEPSPDPITPEPAPAPERTPDPAQPEPIPAPQPEPLPGPQPKPQPQPLPDVPQPLPDPVPTPPPLPEVVPQPRPEETPGGPGPEIPLPPAPDIVQPLPDPNTEPILQAWKQSASTFAITAEEHEQPAFVEETPLPPGETGPADVGQKTKRAPALVITSPYLEEPYEVMIEHEEMTIGRAGSSDILLDYDPFTSRHHALLQLEDGRYMLYDRRSAYGTTVNGQAITSDQAHPLQDGDQISIGQYKLTFFVEAKQEMQKKESQNAQV